MNQEENNKPLTYSIIYHKYRKITGLKLTEYAVADLIHGLSVNTNNQMDGWCYMSKKSMADALGVHKQTIHRHINTLIKKKLVEKNPETKFLRTTPVWKKFVVLQVEREKQNASTPVTKYSSGIDKMFHNINKR